MSHLLRKYSSPEDTHSGNVHVNHKGEREGWTDGERGREMEREGEERDTDIQRERLREAEVR